MFPAGLLVVHNARRGCEDHVAERTGRKHCTHPALDFVQRNAEARRDDTALVDTTVKGHHNLAGAVVVNDLKVADVT